MSIPHKKYKSLTKIQSIEFLELLRDHNLIHARGILGLNTEEGKYYKRKFKANDNYNIEDAIRKLESQLITGTPQNFPYADYGRQSKCEHKDFTIFLKCKCSKVLSENDLDEIIEICTKRKLGQKVLTINLI